MKLEVLRQHSRGAAEPLTEIGNSMRTSGREFIMFGFRQMNLKHLQVFQFKVTHKHLDTGLQLRTGAWVGEYICGS